MGLFMENAKITPVEASHAELRTKDLSEKASRAGNEAHRISIGRKLTEFAILLTAGMLTSTAFPSLNWSMVIWLGLVPLLMIAGTKTAWQAWRAGFTWGYGFSICAFFWLREIEFFIPFAMAAVLALFPAFWAQLIPVLKRKLLIPVDVRLRGFDEMVKYNDQGIGKELLFATSLAAWWCVLEWVRSWVGTGLPWNYLATSQWRNLPLIQICEFTGVYGVSFLIAMVNVTLAMAAESYMKSLRNGKLRRPVAFSVALVLILTAVIAGPISTMRHQIPEGDELVFSLAAIQGDISQRRQADEAAALEALDKYLALSAEAVKLKPDLIVWPETAVPYPFRSRHPVCYRYRTELARLISNSQIPFIIGSIDFENLPEDAGREPGVYNSALFIDASLTVKNQFNKAHIVPFGEFVPFRRFLPEWLIRAIDMGRDLTPGDSFEPIEVFPGVRAGINICFEDVFAYVARTEARLGANMLLVITNDAWYPTSSEPEQHLANSIFRSIETRLPMVRNGNNSATCMIDPSGRIAQNIFMIKDEKTGKSVPDVARRGEGIAEFTVKVARHPRQTFYTRFGDVFIALCGLLVLWAASTALWSWRREKEALAKVFD